MNIYIYIYVCIMINKIYGLYNISYISFRSAISPPSPIPGLIRRLRGSHRFDSTAGSEGHGPTGQVSFFSPSTARVSTVIFGKKTILMGFSDVSDGLSMFKSK